MQFAILKTIWAKNPSGVWAIVGMKGIDLKPEPNSDPDCFKFQNEMQLLTDRPGQLFSSGSPMNFQNLVTSFGMTDFLLKQSILPVVAHAKNENFVRCIGTASVISCTGYIMTACHVLLDPVDEKYAFVKRNGNLIETGDDLSMGVMIPFNPASGISGYRFLPFQKSWYWGEWKDSVLIHEKREDFKYLTDIAICKVPPIPDMAYQPVSLSLNAFKKDDGAFAIGYAEMKDIPIKRQGNEVFLAEHTLDLYVSYGTVSSVYPKNHIDKEVPTPGPCFHFDAKIPGKMSGGPIFEKSGIVVRGVVSQSGTDEKYASGCMVGPIMSIPLENNKSLKELMATQAEGIPQAVGAGL